MFVRYNSTSFDWLFICEPDTAVNVSALVSFLSSIDPTANHAIGRALVDETLTIIHHFFVNDGEEQFLYADFAAGLVLSWSIFAGANIPEKSGFAIDAKHERSRDSDSAARLKAFL
ncbi:unnamed protein product [Gongylonema pulchrum]|uniref:Fringe-like glycosyltransferase domain-containing protein n=1 Tax=Gongylonema pulchrum TaxID=637853 RepID=A0A3P7P9I3_9BILA|nr:unnamed protein product [Gongylonema pulchrum]